MNAVQYSKTAVILLNTTNRINTQETDVISLHFALRVILNIQKNRNLTFTLKTLWFVNFIIRSHSRKWKKSEREPWCINFVYVIIFITKKYLWFYKKYTRSHFYCVLLNLLPTLPTILNNNRWRLIANKLFSYEVKLLIVIRLKKFCSGKNLVQF